LFILPEALMSDTNEPISTCPPSNPIKIVDKDGYRASFYPGFVSRLAVRDAAGMETELYMQEAPFCLPPGYKKPWPTSTLEFSRPDGRRIVLQIEDPHQQIGRIEVHLKDSSTSVVRSELVQRITGETEATLSSEPPPPEEPDLVLICEDGPVLCPPWCPIDGGT
jgi:hypothetical protein